MENNAYYEDLRYRKNLAGQARHRKGNRGGRKCSLPSDRLTEKQWKERCGEVVTYQMGVPISWKEFCGMPNERKREYILSLQEKYHVNAAALCRMFGVTPSYFSHYMKRAGAEVEFPVRRMSREEREEFDRFCGVAPEAECEPDTNASETDQEPGQAPGEVSARQSAGCTMDGLCLRFGGEVDLRAVYNSMKAILGDNPGGTIEVIWNRNNSE